MAAPDARWSFSAPVLSHVRRFLVPAICAIAVVGCGHARAAPAPRVRLQVTSPPDGARVSSASVTVSGSVSPRAATVLVMGRSVTVRRGAFSTEVSLSPGTNIIDVLAGAARAQGAASALRVERYVVVKLPNLKGDTPDYARSRLRSLGLTARINDGTDPFDFLIPLPRQVCGTSPGAGRSVPGGSPVTVYVAKVC